MKLVDYLTEDLVLNTINGDTKEAILEEMVTALQEKGIIEDKGKALAALLEREKLGTTGIGEEIAIPHAKLGSFDDIRILVAVRRDGIDFDSIDKIPVKIIFLVLASEKQMNLHLKTLARISRLVRLTGFKERALKAESAKELFEILVEEESRL